MRQSQSSGDATPAPSILIRPPLVGERSHSAAIQSGDGSQLCAIDRVWPIYSHFQCRKSGSRSWFQTIAPVPWSASREARPGYAAYCGERFDGRTLRALTRLRTRAKNNFGFGDTLILTPPARTKRSRFGAAKARPSPIGWERENRPPSVGVSNRFANCERQVWLFPLPSDGRGSG